MSDAEHVRIWSPKEVHLGVAAHIEGSRSCMGGRASEGRPGAALQEGTGGRTGCTATWSESMSVLTVDCGGQTSNHSCIAKLTRTSTKCP